MISLLLALSVVSYAAHAARIGSSLRRSIRSSVLGTGAGAQKNAGGNLYNAQSKTPLADWLPEEKKLWLCITSLGITYQHSMTPLDQAASNVLAQQAKDELFQYLGHKFDQNHYMNQDCDAFGKMVVAAIQQGTLVYSDDDSRDQYCSGAVKSYPFQYIVVTTTAAPTTPNPDLTWKQDLIAASPFR